MFAPTDWHFPGQLAGLHVGFACTKGKFCTSTTSKPLENTFAVPLVLARSLICGSIRGEVPAEQMRSLRADFALMYCVSIGDCCGAGRLRRQPMRVSAVPHDKREKQLLLCPEVVLSKGSL